MTNNSSPLPPVANADRAPLVSMVLPSLHSTVITLASATAAASNSRNPNEGINPASLNMGIFHGSASAFTPMKAAEHMQMGDSSLSPLKDRKATASAKQWHRCDVCSKSYEREETLVDHMTRHRNQMKKRQQRMQVDEAIAEQATKAPRTLLAPCVKSSPAVRLKLIP